MGSIRRFGVALVVAGVLAGTLGAPLEAADKKPKPDPNAAVCAYLQAIIEYPGVNQTILAWAMALFNKYGCTMQ